MDEQLVIKDDTLNIRGEKKAARQERNARARADFGYSRWWSSKGLAKEKKKTRIAVFVPVRKERRRERNPTTAGTLHAIVYPMAGTVLLLLQGRLRTEKKLAQSIFGREGLDQASGTMSRVKPGKKAEHEGGQVGYCPGGRFGS